MHKFAITDDELEKRYDSVNISKVDTYYPFNDNNTTEKTIVDLVHNKGSMYYVHIEFSPVGVFYTGDMGSFTFNGRLICNPTKFFRGSSINPGYWSEKVCAAPQGYYERTVNSDTLNKSFKEEVIAYKLSEDISKVSTNSIEMVLPSVYMDRDTIESAYDAVAKAWEDSGMEYDSEGIYGIVQGTIEPDYLYMYACKVLQWVCNKIIAEENNQNAIDNH